MARVAADDARWMARCLELARRGAGRVSPNPLVGSVIVSPRGEVVAEGWHKKLGGPHGEAEALAACGGRAPGCTLYVNLEPCRHTSTRRTEPCAPKVLEAGVARLVIGANDPIPGHGGGAAWLARRGVKVTRNVLRDECEELNRTFFTWAREHRPYVVLKAASTLDGRVATAGGESQWITGAAARRDGHGLRGELDAILVGVGTALADDPRLTARGRGRDPVRVVLDSQLRTPRTARLLPAASRSKVRVIIATTASAPAARERALVRAGAEVWRLGRRRRVDLAALVERLAAEEVASLLVEGGGEVHRSFLDAGLVDEVRLYLAPMAVAGGTGWIGGRGVAALADAWRFRFIGEPRRLGDDLALTLRPRTRPKRR